MQTILPEPENSRAARIVWQKLFLLFDFIYAIFQIYFVLFSDINNTKFVDYTVTTSFEDGISSSST